MTIRNLPYISNLQRVDFESRYELMWELPEVTDALWQHIDSFLACVQASLIIKMIIRHPALIRIIVKIISN